MSVEVGLPRAVGDVTIIDCAGQITFGKGVARLRETIRGLVGQGKTKVVLKLTDVTRLDSAGAEELATSFTALADTGGRLKLLAPSQEVKDVLCYTRLDIFFIFYEDEAAAVRSFK